jgi:hypothetical protein
MKRAATIGLGLGAILLLTGLFLRFLVVPDIVRLPYFVDLAVLPDDVDEARQYEGTMGVLLNSEALASNDLANLFIRDVPITVDRQVTVLETSRGDALVQDSAVVSSPQGPVPGLASDDFYSISRKTMLTSDRFEDDERVIPREGLVVGFPIGTDEKDYVGWNGDTLAPATLIFVEKQERAGLDTLYFTASSDPELIRDPGMLANFPPALPKAALAGLVPALGLPDQLVAQVSAVLETLPDPVPLSYGYAYETQYWVEPTSGVLVDYAKTESRSVGLEVGGSFVPLTEVLQLSYEQSDASVADAADDAEGAKGQLAWLGTYIPWGLIIIGGVAVIGGLAAMRGKEDAI